MQNQVHILTLVKKLIIKILNLKLVIYLEFQNKQNIFAKGYIRDWSEEVFVTKKIKITLPWIYFITHLKGEEIVGTFYEKELSKQFKKSLELKK